MYADVTSVTVARACKINGVTFAVGAVLNGGQIAGIPRLSALLSNGTLKVNPDPHARRLSTRAHVPTNLNPAATAKLIEESTSPAAVEGALNVTVVVDVKKATATIAGGDGPFEVEWSDGATSSVVGRTSSHTFAAAGAASVTVTDSEDVVDSANFTLL